MWDTPGSLKVHDEAAVVAVVAWTTARKMARGASSKELIPGRSGGRVIVTVVAAHRHDIVSHLLCTSRSVSSRYTVRGLRHDCLFMMCVVEYLSVCLHGRQSLLQVVRL